MPHHPVRQKSPNDSIPDAHTVFSSPPVTLFSSPSHIYLLLPPLVTSPSPGRAALSIDLSPQRAAIGLQQKEDPGGSISSLAKGKMDVEQQGDNMVAKGGGAVQWPSAMSSFMLTYLAQLVASGTKTSTGFKQVHLNACAKALNDKMGSHYTGTQVGNHIRKWKKTYAKIQKLKNLSGALWDEETCIISLEKEHYIGHVQDHREDAKYLNTPLEHYHEMATIFGNSLATGLYAKGAYDPLATEVTEVDNEPKGTEDATATTEQVGVDDVTTSVNNTAGESSGIKPPPPKKAKVINVEDPTMAMVSMLGANLENLATAITDMTKAVTPDDDIPEGLYEDVTSIPGFDAAHLEDYYAHLCEHPREARQFYKLPRLSSKMIWVSRYIKKYLSNDGL